MSQAQGWAQGTRRCLGTWKDSQDNMEDRGGAENNSSATTGREGESKGSGTRTLPGEIQEGHTEAVASEST